MSNNFLPGTKTARVPGVEHRYEFNGLTLNDRSGPDRYQITKVTGFEDPDIRDAREVNPGYHGETAFSSYYGGRTIMLEGVIQAGNLEKLRDMQSALKAALVPLVEYPLYIRNPGGASRDTYTLVRKNASLQGSEQQSHHDRWVRPFQITFRASDPRLRSVASTTATYTFAGTPPLFTDYFSTAYADLETSVYNEEATPSAPAYSNSGVVNGAVSDPYMLSYTGDTYEDYRVSVGFYNRAGGFAVPNRGTVMVFAKFVDANNYIYAVGNRADNLASGHPTLRIKKVVAGVTTTLATAVMSVFFFTVEFATVQLEQEGNALTATVYNGKLSTGLTNTLLATNYTLTGGDATLFGTGVTEPVGFGFDWETAASLTQANLINLDDFQVVDLNASPLAAFSITNSGNFVAIPVIRFTGPLSDPYIQDSATNKILALIGVIDSGDWIEIDLSTGIAVNQDGLAASNFIDDATSNLPGIEPGVRSFVVGSNTWTNPTSQVSVTFASSWV